MLRAETLLPFSSGWINPTGEEVKFVINKLNLSSVAVASLLGVSEGRTIRRWTSGQSAIPYSAWAILCHEAGYGNIWKLTD